MKNNTDVNTKYLVYGKYSVTDLLDIKTLGQIFEKFSQATGFTTGFVEYPSQKILIATGWRDICTKFHRVNAKSVQHCKKSNINLTKKLTQLKKINIEECENGLVDGASPIIVQGTHIANLCTGQILLKKPDLKFFRKQAKLYGYDTEEYLKALQEVPVVTKKQFTKVLSFLSEIAVLLAELGLMNLKFKEKSKNLECEILERKKLMVTVEAKSRDLKTILYISSHDLRSPLVNIYGFSNELKKSCHELTNIINNAALPSNLNNKIDSIITDEIPLCLNQIDSNVKKMERLLNSLMQLSQLNEKFVNMNYINMNILIEETLNTMQDKIQSSDTVIVANKLPDCLSDKSLVQSLFFSLIDNAIKFSDKNRKCLINISGKKENDYSIYCVQDNGIGICSKYHDKIFEMFHRLNVDNELSGEGIGLFIAKKVMHMLNGKIWVESEEKKGSRFYCMFPNTILDIKE